MRILLTISALVLLTLPLIADPWPDAVVSVEFGAGAGFGQGEVYPDNILGPPDPTASPSAPSSTDDQVLSLGSGGEIVLAFEDGGIVDGNGADFTVFENPFLVAGGPAIFREVALIAVSEDGVEWVEFPYDSETLTGLAGVTPTNGDADPLDPAASGGDSFDLADVGLNHATYLRITDAGDAVSDNGDSFDLDAVAVIHGESPDMATPEVMTSIPSAMRITAWPNPFNAQVTVRIDHPVGLVHLALFDMLGRQIVSTDVLGGEWSWAPNDLASGTYILRVVDSKGVATTSRLVLLR